MAKTKKTLAQKKKTDTRKNYSPSVSNATGSSHTASFSLSGYEFSATPKKSPASTVRVSATHGLRMTLILSSVIVIVQLAFFFLLTHHILILPWKGITY